MELFREEYLTIQDDYLRADPSREGADIKSQIDPDDDDDLLDDDDDLLDDDDDDLDTTIAPDLDDDDDFLADDDDFVDDDDEDDELTA